MSDERRLAGALIVTAVGAVALVVLDTTGPIRALTTIVLLLAGPGLALSLLMGPMSLAARTVVAVAGSVATVTLVSLLLLFAGVWSGPLGVACVAAIVSVLSVDVLRRDPTSSEPPDPGDDMIPSPPEAGRPV